MKRTNSNKFFLFASFALLLFPAIGRCAEVDLKIEMRVLPESEKFRVICRATNVSDEEVSVGRKLLHASNLIRVTFLNDPDRYWFRIMAHAGEPYKVQIPPSTTKEWVSEERMKDAFRNSSEFVRGTRTDKRHFIQANWLPNQIDSSPRITLAFAGEDGEIQTPVIEEGSDTDEYLLGFIYDENNPLQLVFLVLNGKDEAVSLENPLTRNSRIIATSPSMESTRELVDPDMDAERVVVEAGEVGEWRIPWQTVLDLIPEQDLDEIKAAGGDLDLVWKVGDRQSDPLPITLDEPATNSNEE